MHLHKVNILHCGKSSTENWLLSDHMSWQRYAQTKQLHVLQIEPIPLKTQVPNYHSELLSLFKTLAVQSKMQISILNILRQYVRYSKKYERLWLCFHLSSSLENGKTIAQAFLECNFQWNFALSIMQTCQGEQESEKGFSFIAESIELQDQIKKAFKKAMRYPVYLAGIALIIIWGICFFIVPNFAEFYQQQNLETPAVTEILFHFSSAMMQPKYYFYLGLLLAMIVLFRNPIKHSMMSLVFTSLHRSIELVQFSQIIHIAVASGINIKRALELANNTFSSGKLHSHTLATIASINAGTPVINALCLHEDFPEYWKDLLINATSAQAMAHAWKYIADRQSELTTEKLQNIATIIEPLAITAIGGLTGGMLIMLYTPLFQMGQSL